MQQKNSTLSAYNLNLHRENNDLRRKLHQYTEFESAMSEAVDNVANRLIVYHLNSLGELT